MNVKAIYEASNADDTRLLYARLQEFGVVGVIALNLLRAQKASARAKVYRGGAPGRGSYRGMAYEKKDWSLGQLVYELVKWSHEFGISWGWKEDPTMEPGAPHRWVLYVDLPTGQASFHSSRRMEGPDYAGDWDGVREASPGRIIAWAQSLLDGDLVVACAPRGVLRGKSPIQELAETLDAFKQYEESTTQLDLSLDLDNPQEG